MKQLPKDSYSFTNFIDDPLPEPDKPPGFQNKLKPIFWYWLLESDEGKLRGKGMCKV